MNYITSCPACETQFLLTTEHIKAHRGKVQCGHCEHIFNAKNRLTEVSDDIRSASEYNASLATSPQNAVSPASSEDKPINEVLNGVLESVPNLQDLTTHVEANIDSGDPFIGEQTHIEIEDNYSYQDETPIVIDDLASDAKLESNAFVKKKTKLNIWLVPLSLLLITMAVLQAVYYFRSKIAAEYPQFKPYLVQACAALQCEIQLPANLALFTIDDSDMQESEDHQNVIKFSSSLINNANYTQAYPNIELTLTDTDDQAVLRRHINPSEYLAANTDIAAGMAGKAELRVKLAISVADISVAGYRVQLLY
jgi:predicted Zn finger-like uncharacterized protein